MFIEVTSDIVKTLIKEGNKNPAILELEDRWHGLSINTKFCSIDDLDRIYELAEKANDREGRKIVRKLEAYIKVLKSKDKPIIKLNILADLAVDLIATLPNKRAYTEGPNGNLLPWYVTKIKYVERDGRDNPPHIEIIVSAYRRGAKVNSQVSIYREDLGSEGKTALSLFSDKLNWLLETEDLNAAYEQEMLLYQDYFPHTGKQFLAFGSANIINEERSRWKYDTLKLGTKDNASKVVMDDLFDVEGKESKVVDASFWSKSFEDQKEEKDLMKLPVHPYLRVFDLRQHEFVGAHVNQMVPYVYDTKISDKLILDEDKKWMIDTLVNTIDQEGSDIITGKSGGIIVLSSGAPGTGKTLTAEVFSEASRKALYVVQCSQLGIDPDTLEKELNIVLERAQRWCVVLLIDEADVYIHERGNNMVQNAVVGVFLRLLEYYSGILFLTTNRSTIVDDAIISRVTAHVRYTLPNAVQKKALWKTLSKQYKLILTDSLVNTLVKEFPVISGRTIMKLVRLVKVIVVKKRQPPTIKMFKEAATFQAIENKKEV